MGWERIVVGFTQEPVLLTSGHRLVAALEAEVWLVLSGQQVAPNSQNKSGPKWLDFTLDWVKTRSVLSETWYS